MIHPEAPEFLSAAALYNAPIDVEEAAKHIEILWNEDVSLHWDDVEGGRILRFTLENVLVLLTPVAQPMRTDKGQLPDHRFHVAITCFSPIDSSQLPDTDVAASVDSSLPREVQLRKRALAAHVVLTELADALMREPAAIGLFRPELGVVQPPNMVTELADLLAKGQAPLPLWVGIRTFKPGLAFARTLGMNLFGHLDLEVVDSVQSEADIYSMLANIADYIIASDAFIMPGQSVGYREGEKLAVTQATSPADNQPVLRIDF